MDEVGNFKTCLSGDAKGILCLYEASILSIEGETILDLAKDFAAYQLRELIRLEQITDWSLAKLVRRALEIPLRWRVQKLEAKWWYKESGLPQKLNFARHRLAKCFLWGIGLAPKPHLGDARKILAKVAIFVTMIDDIYDVYGTLDEIEAFTKTIERWDINELDRLPEYMRICFLALFNFVNELAYDVLRDQGLNIISKLRNLWAELCRAYHLEAKWYYNGYFPSTHEYLNTAWISISGPVVLFNAYFTTTNPINKKELQNLEQYPGIIRWPSMVTRLMDDLGTTTDEMKKGDVPKSIQCYMQETGCSEENAREYIKHLIDMTLKRMNKDILIENPIKDLGAIAMNAARISLCFYQYGDGFGSPHCETKKNLVSLIVKPISML